MRSVNCAGWAGECADELSVVMVDGVEDVVAEVMESEGGHGKK